MILRFMMSLALVMTLASTTAWGNVTVKRDPPEIQRITFDPANPPKDMPHLEEGEAAVTKSLFRILAAANSEVVSRKKGDDGNWTDVIAIHGVTLTLKLQITIWVPQGASEKLKAHEEGHRKISEQVYKEHAQTEGKACMASIDGQHLTGHGPDWKSAANDAINPPINEAGKNYLKNTAGVEDDISHIYDEITHHGTNDIPEDDAIKQAFERYKANHDARK